MARIHVAKGYDQAAPAPTPTSFRAVTTGGPIADPVVGQTVAVFDQPNKTFRQKRIRRSPVITPGQMAIDVLDRDLASDDLHTDRGPNDFAWSDSLELARRADVDIRRRVGPG